MARAHGRRGPTFAAVAAAAAVLGGCASPPHPGEKPPAREAIRAAPAPADDWRSLITVPFGTLLKDVPYRLGEIVMFHDSPGSPAAHGDRECYTLQGTPPPQWFGRPVSDYSLCFSSDRLNLIEASVSLPAESASARFAAACREWQRRGTPGAAAADRCEYREGTTAVEATLTGAEATPTSAGAAVTAAEASGEPTATLSMTLIDPAPPRDGTP
jgi:hypothetical protein